MRRRRLPWLIGMMACVVVAAMVVPTHVFAQASPPPASAGNAITPPSECDGFVGVTHRLAGCLRVTIDAGAQRFFDGVYPSLQATIGAVITLAIVVYGVMLSFGLVEKVGRDTFILLIKIAAITAFVTSSPFVFRSITNAMDGAAAAVVSYSPPSGAADGAGSDFAQSECMKNMIEAQANNAPGKPVITPWLGIDCLIDSVIGIKILPATGSTAAVGSGDWFNRVYQDSNSNIQGSGVARGLMYFFFSSMQSSVMGGVLALIGGFFIYGLLFLIVRAFFGYIAGYMGIALLVILSPLFIPMLLFRDTKQYFDKWAKMLIGFAMQPIVMLVFIIFSLTAVDLAAFSGNYSIMYTIAGDASRTAPFSLNKYLTDPRTVSGAVDTANPPSADSKPIIDKENRAFMATRTTPRNADADFRTPLAAANLGGVADNLANSQCTPEKLKQAAAGLPPGASNPLKTACNAKYDISARLNKIDWERMAAARSPAVANVTPVGEETQGQAAGKKIAQEVIAAVFFCVMVVFVLNGILAVVPKIINDLVGDALQSADLNDIFLKKDGAGGGQRSEAVKGAGQSFSAAASSMASKLTAPLTGGR